MTTNSPRTSLLNVISEHQFARVLQNKLTGQKLLVASSCFKPGDVICQFSAGTTHRFPTYLTVQIGIKKHITLVPEFLQYINHSCDPTAFFDTTRMELVCLKTIRPGVEITFFYPSTEWEMAQPFSCNCGSPDCLKLINGASHLSPEILEKYMLTDFIQNKVNKQILI
jgi:hypothetical protein